MTMHNGNYQTKHVFFSGNALATKYAYSQQLQMRWGINQPTTYWHPCLLFRKSIPKYVIPEIPSRANSGGAYEKARKTHFGPAQAPRLEPPDAKLHVHPPSRLSMMRGGTHVFDMVLVPTLSPMCSDGHGARPPCAWRPPMARPPMARPPHRNPTVGNS